MMSRHVIFGLIVMALCASAVSAKEFKIGYVDSEAILSQYDAYTEAQNKLKEEEQKFVAEMNIKEEAIRAMQEEIKQQSLMLSAEARAERENRLGEKLRDLDQFRSQTWGEGGKLFTRNLELSRPILEKVNMAIETVSRLESYDMVFDAASGNIVFALPEHDLTELVVAELKKD
ncbi:OmpH family outer membrane protein [bacterium]|jgi:outer membrane protein|nr:OmpH family outer membrane protein [bacterium]